MPALRGGDRPLGRLMLRLGLAVAAAIWVADRLVKWPLIDWLSAEPKPVALGPFLDLVMVWNPGISFGLLQSEAALTQVLLSAFALAVVAGLLWWLRRAETRMVAAAIGLIVGGALGNVVDRLSYGGVADFFYFHLGEYYWPAFNVADAAIVVGVGGLLIDALLRKAEGHK